MVVECSYTLPIGACALSRSLTTSGGSPAGCWRLELDIAVLIVEDDPLDRAVLEAAVAFAGFRPFKAASALEAVEMIAQRNFAALLVSTTVRDIHILELLRLIRERCSTPLLVLADATKKEDLVPALESGADDFVTKSLSATELVARLRSLVRRGGMQRREEDGLEGVDRPGGRDPLVKTDVFDRPVREPLKFGELSLAGRPPRVECHGRTAPLTDSEYKILHLLVSNVNNIVAKPEFLKALDGGSFGPGSKLVEVYVSRLRRVLQRLDGGKWKIENYRRLGWCLTDDSSLTEKIYPEEPAE
jgi:DNA-binding response OmpR family regulator